MLNRTCLLLSSLRPPTSQSRCCRQRFGGPARLILYNYSLVAPKILVYHDLHADTPPILAVDLRDGLPKVPIVRDVCDAVVTAAEELSYDLIFLKIGKLEELVSKNYRSFASQHDLVISGSASAWFFLMMCLHLPRDRRTIVVECKNLGTAAKPVRVGDPEFRRLCAIGGGMFEGTAELGVFFARFGATGFRGYGCSHGFSLEAARATQALFHAKTGKYVEGFPQDSRVLCCRRMWPRWFRIQAPCGPGRLTHAHQAKASDVGRAASEPHSRGRIVATNQDADAQSAPLRDVVLGMPRHPRARRHLACGSSGIAGLPRMGRATQRELTLMPMARLTRPTQASRATWRLLQSGSDLAEQLEQRFHREVDIAQDLAQQSATDGLPGVHRDCGDAPIRMA